MRRYVVIGPIVLSMVILLGFGAAAQRPQPSVTYGMPVWEYGSLELAQTGRGTAYVFSRYTAEGRTERVLDVRPLSTQPPPLEAEAALGGTDAAAARSMARLGSEGWELVTESQFARFGGAAPVLMFKRPAGGR